MRPLLTLLLIAAAVYLLLIAQLYFLQHRMVFLANLPGRELTATPADLGLAFEEVSLTAADGVRLHGWFVPAPGARTTLLFLHGNAGNISHRLDSIAIFHELGLDTLIIDYRGYGRSEGRPSEAGTYRDAAAAWEHLVRERGVDPRRIVVFGRSLGGAVAARLAAERPAAALIIESCFSSALDMARALYPWLPARLITRLDYPVAADVARGGRPVLVVHSRDDEIIPFAMGEAIYRAARGPRELLELRGDHNGGFLRDRTRYRDALGAFIARHLPPAGG